MTHYNAFMTIITPDTIDAAHTECQNQRISEMAEKLSQAIVWYYDGSDKPMKIEFGGVCKEMQPLLASRMRESGWLVTYSRLGRTWCGHVIVEPLPEA